LKIFRCLKLHFEKIFPFFELRQSAAAAAATMIFSEKNECFREANTYTDLLKKNFEKIMKNIGDMAKRTFIKKMQKNLNFYYM